MTGNRVRGEAATAVMETAAAWQRAARAGAAVVDRFAGAGALRRLPAGADRRRVLLDGRRRLDGSGVLHCRVTGR